MESWEAWLSTQYVFRPTAHTISPVSLHDHRVWVDTRQARLASGTGLAESLHFGSGASGSMAVEVQPQHPCGKASCVHYKSSMLYSQKPKIGRYHFCNYKSSTYHFCNPILLHLSYGIYVAFVSHISSVV